jgi:Methyltransferase FkbM domain
MTSAPGSFKRVARAVLEKAAVSLPAGAASRLASILVRQGLLARAPKDEIRKLLRECAALLPRQVLLQEARALGGTLGIQECYAQEGEDLVLARMFEEKKDGFYVDVGAHHPIRFSNTYLLYQAGWSGINIDATPGSMREFCELRPRDINIECMISSRSEPGDFYLMNEPALNTASEDVVSRLAVQSPEYHQLQRVRLQPQSLAAILDRHLPQGTEIDLLSIDVEGSDLDVLRSNDWSRYLPGMILVEGMTGALGEWNKDEIGKFLFDRGYGLIAKFYNSALFRRSVTG